MSRRLAKFVPVIVSLGLLFFAAPKAQAQEWFDLYEKGLAALRKQQPVVAASYFERALQKNPKPGENVLTYGTNRLAAYHPHLRHAEALAMAGDLDRARKALEASERSGKEPAAERLRVMKIITAGSHPAIPAPLPESSPVPNIAPTPVPPPVAPFKPAPTEQPGPIATPTPLTSGNDTSSLIAKAPPLAATASSPRIAKVSDPTPTAAPDSLLVSTPLPQSTDAELEVTTNPGGADVYLDGEFIGRSDAQGRLVKKAVVPGPHELRVSLQGFDEAKDNIDVVSGVNSKRIVVLERPAASGNAAGAFWPAIILGSVLVLATFVLGLRFAKTNAITKEPAPKLGETELRPRRTPATAGGVTELNTPLRSAVPATVALPITPPAVGTSTFGEYQLHEQIGKGGMAVVFRAERRGEIVALKRPLAAFLSETEFVERFVREAEIGRTLNHPSIIRIFEKGRVGESPFFTMELVDGETLHTLLRREGALPPRDACQVVKQIAEALDYSHLKGVVHRDLKPSNIMILKSGVVKVMDYGIARSARLEGLTATGAFLGTPEYVAPETAEGGKTDARSDLYSLGVVFYEVLTGVRPFVGDTPFATLKKICSEAPTPPSVVRNCPAQLEVIVLKLLQKKPDDRHASAEDLLNDLNDYLNSAA